MIIRRVYTAWALLAFLQQDDPVVTQLRSLLTEHGRFPTRHTWERRLRPDLSYARRRRGRAPSYYHKLCRALVGPRD